jgi:hypothetical protein
MRGVAQARKGNQMLIGTAQHAGCTQEGLLMRCRVYLGTHTIESADQFPVPFGTTLEQGAQIFVNLVAKATL